MDVVRWVCAGVLGAVAACAILGNWFIAFRNIRAKDGGSLVPIVGGLFGTASLLLVPGSPVGGWWWAPLVIDLGCVPVLLWATVWTLRSRFSRPGQT
jgi:hypothetical protein